MKIEAENINFLDTIKAAESVEELEQARVGLLGKKGEVTYLLRSLRQMNDEERKLKSPQYNKLKQTLEEAIKEKREVLVNSCLLYTSPSPRD